MEFVSKESVPFFSDCELLVEGLGYKLVDLSIQQRNETKQIKAVIKSEKGVGIDDCTIVHRALLPRLEALLGTQETTMEVSSPGVNRVLKHSWEFYAFIGEEIAIWNVDITDWVTGILKEVNSNGIVFTANGSDTNIEYKNIKKAKANL